MSTAVVLAAGRGSRLGPLTETRPKPMVPLANRPIVGHVLDALSRAGVTDVVLVVGYRRDRIQSYVGDGARWDLDVTYVVQNAPLGTGDALARAEGHVGESFLVVNGDTVIEAALVERLLAVSDAGESAVTVIDTDRAGSYGAVDVEDGRVVGITETEVVEASSSVLVNAGVYAMTDRVFDVIAEARTGGGAGASELGVTSLVDRLAADERPRTLRVESGWLPVNYLWDVVNANATVLRNWDVGDAAAGDSTAGGGPNADATAAVSAGSAVADTATVGPNASVLEETSLGANATVGANAVVSNSVVLPDATVEPGAVVRDAVVGADATVGANATLEGGPARVAVDGRVHEGVVLGGVVGDRASVGANATVVPGTVLDVDATTRRGELLSNWLDEDF